METLDYALLRNDGRIKSQKNRARGRLVLELLHLTLGVFAPLRETLFFHYAMRRNTPAATARLATLKDWLAAISQIPIPGLKIPM